MIYIPYSDYVESTYGIHETVYQTHCYYYFNDEYSAQPLLRDGAKKYITDA